MCAECGQMFTRLGHLRRHTRLHTGDKPFMCNRCACQFARADHLRRHLQAHHADDPSLRPKDPNSANFPALIKSEFDVVPTSTDDLPLLGVLSGHESRLALNLPVFPGPEMEKFDAGSHKSRQSDADLIPAAGDNLSSFSMLPGGGNGQQNEVGTAESLPVFPGHGVEKSATEADQSNYQAANILADLRLEGVKVAVSKDQSHTATTTAASNVSYDTGEATSLPMFSRHGEEKPGTRYSAVEAPVEHKNTPLEGRKSASTEDCDRGSTAPSRFHESNSNSTLSPLEHRNFPLSGDSAVFRTDFWHRTSPAYMNDRLFLAGAANFRHFDVDFSRSPEPVPTNLARRYSQSHSMMPGNFLGGVVDFRRLPPENPAVTSQQTDTDIPDASPLSLARYQRK